MLKKLLAVTALAGSAWLLPALASAQALPSLDFETRSVVNPARPAGWNISGTGYAVALDSIAPKQGRFSVRSQRSPKVGVAPSPQMLLTFGVPVAAVRGKKLKLTGWIRSDSMTAGWSGLFFSVSGPKGTLAFDNMFARAVHGTTQWQRYETEFAIDTSATTITLGFMHVGTGVAWFDSVGVLVDDKPYEYVPIMPSHDEVQALKRHTYPIKTESAGSGFADLASLGKVFGDARIVSLGEGTHGTAEYFRMKHRVTEYLAVNKKFGIFAIEANMPEARIVNEYVLTGRGNAKDALKGLYFWTWNTEEVLALIEWMRAYNKSGRGRMEFWGFDMQYPNVAADSVLAFIKRHDPAFDSAASAEYLRVKTVAAAADSGKAGVDYGTWSSAARVVLEHISARRVDYLKMTDSMEVAWAEQNARIVLQAVDAASHTGATRDSSMALNVKWMMDHSAPGSKAVLWAHNGHVARETGWMGSYLDKMYGSAMRVVGFAMGEGSYTASGVRGLDSYRSGPPQPGSVEALLDTWNMDRLALDLRSAALEPSAKWLRQPQPVRMIGAVAMDGGYKPMRLADAFDVLIYFRHTTHTIRLPR